MDVVLKGLLTLVRSAITEEALPLPDGFTMEEALPAIRKHQIVTMAYDGAVRCGVSRTLPQMQELFGLYCRLMTKSERQMGMLEKLLTRFDENGIDYMPLKGTNLKKLYPKAELRLMGDADILIRTEQYDRIRPLVEQLGFQEKLESDHELVWQNDALFLELHKRIIPSYNRDYYEYFGDGWRLARPVTGTRYGMKPEDEWIYLFTHFAKHYRDGGIGIRHVTDLWVWRRANPQMDETYIHGELKKLQLVEFYDNTVRLLSCWFEAAAEDERTAVMSRFLSDSGTWGTRENRILSGEVRLAADTGTVTDGRFRHLRDGLFPRLAIMQDKYPVLKKAPVLLPLFWPVRWITAVLFRRENLRRQKRSMELSSAEHVETYQEALRFVGLDFNFKE